MKTALILPLGCCVLAALLVAAKPTGETLPDGAAGKIAEAIPKEAFAKPAKERTVLVFARTAGFRHASIPTGKVALSELGKQTGAFEVVVSDDLSNFETGKIDKFDAIIFLNTTGDVFKGSKKAKELQDNLMAFVKGGKGFVGIHAATDTLYNMPEYGEMMGGYFNGHPWGAKTSVHIAIEEGKEDHPLVAMFEGKPLEFKEEIYEFKDPYDSDKVDMLLRLDPKKSDRGRKSKRSDGDYGVAWARKWGDGRVFYCSLGHNNDIYWHPKVLSHYLAGIQWAIGDYKVDVSK